LIFERRQDLDHQPTPYLLKLHPPIGALKDYFRFTCAALSSDSEPHPWGDVSFPHLVRELSLRSTVLRSSSESILVVANYFLESSDLGGKPTSHRVLTYHFISPSNPVNPMTFLTCKKVVCGCKGRKKSQFGQKNQEKSPANTTNKHFLSYFIIFTK